MHSFLKITFSFLLAISSALVFYSCDEEEQKPILIESIILNPEATTIIVGAGATLEATVLPKNAENKNLVWSSSDDNIATVNQAGAVKAISAGEAIISAAAEVGEIVGTSTITVKEPVVPVDSLSLDKNKVILEVIKSEILTVTISPENATNKNVRWNSSVPSVASVSESGVIKALKPGITTIKVFSENGNKSAACQVSVLEKIIFAEEITLDQTTITLAKLGRSVTLTATISPDNASNKQVVWTSEDETIATVTQNGTVSPKGVGTTKISVSLEDGSKTATCQVTVQEGDIVVTGVTLNPTTLTLTAGGSTSTLTATVAPENATNKTVSWTTSNAEVATVSNGVVTPVAVGTATITATTQDGSKTATCSVTVKAATVAVTGVTLSPTTLTLIAGGSTSSLTATVAPANATNKTVSWKSNDEEIATVSNGVVTPVAAGTASITATTQDGSKTATCSVTVKAATVAVTGVTLSSTTLTLTAGGSTSTLTATVAPENATNKTVSWTTSNAEVATVSNGVVTPIAAGSAAITVTTQEGNKTATCSVTVEAANTTVAVTGVTLNKTTLSLPYDTNETLTATIAPTNATNKAVTWASGDENIVTVSTSGKVTAVGLGKATITVTTQDGSFEASCEVTVNPKEFTLMSDAFDNEGTMPIRFGVYFGGPNCVSNSAVSPPFTWTGAPSTGVGSYVVLMIDASISGLHFSWFDSTNPLTTSLTEGQIGNSYFPPSPGGRIHRYVFRIYAVKANNELDFSYPGFEDTHQLVLEHNSDIILGYSNIYAGNYGCQ